MKIGQLCLKIAGRDAGNFCLVIDKIDDTFVLIDGNVRRKKCNIKHLEPIDKILKIKKNAPTSEVKKAMEQEGIKIIQKGKARTPGKKPVKKRRIKQKPVEEVAKKPKEEKKKQTKKSEEANKEEKKNA